VTDLDKASKVVMAEAGRIQLAVCLQCEIYEKEIAALKKKFHVKPKAPKKPKKEKQDRREYMRKYMADRRAAIKNGEG